MRATYFVECCVERRSRVQCTPIVDPKHLPWLDDLIDCNLLKGVLELLCRLLRAGASELDQHIAIKGGIYDDTALAIFDERDELSGRRFVIAPVFPPAEGKLNLERSAAENPTVIRSQQIECH